MARLRSAFLVVCLLAPLGLASAQPAATPAIPLPEHPRPDFERPQWQNLNGLWAFRFDAEDAGRAAGWHAGTTPFPHTITVPFPWGAPASGVADSARIGWYARDVVIPADWAGRRVFLTVGAADWHTTAWLDGAELGTHEGGYTPFSFELTDHVTPGATHRLVVRVDDEDRPFTLEGKQGYGDARGIWQTPYLEARGDAPLAHVHFTPDLAGERVRVEARLVEPAPAERTLRLAFRTGGVPEVVRTIPAGEAAVAFDVPIPDVRPWSLDDPFLYEVTARVEGGAAADEVATYFGMREISVVDLPGRGIPYVALNGEPVYLQLALDQAYHPEGFYAFPSDEALRDEVLMARQIGLNGLRVHIKVPLPRKLYWADRLGMLVMADVPNGWGPPVEAQRREVEYAMRQMIARDYNHPSIFSWIPFNETWGLRTRDDAAERDVYLDETKDWVVSVVRQAKALDPTRLVEDNSVCCGVGHTETDLNSWHAYLPGWEWEAALDRVAQDGTYPDGAPLFEPGYEDQGQPNINSEFGNVWGYEGSTGDVDWSWDYHLAVNAFRRHPEVAGWLYTEHHDVVNEWNGYWRYDRSQKFTGMDALVNGMTLQDLHAPLYVAVGDPSELARTVAPGETVEVPLYASFLSGTDAVGDSLRLRFELYGWDTYGQRATHATPTRTVAYRPYRAEPLAPLTLRLPDAPGVYVLASRLESRTAGVLSRNFTTFVASGQPAGRTRVDGRPAYVARVRPDAHAEATWSRGTWTVLDGLKVNGAGHGAFTYRIPWPEGLAPADVESAAFLVEASSRPLLDKDRDDAAAMGGDYMRGEGTLSPHRNPNAYPMTDEARNPSAVAVTVNGHPAGQYDLADDPADHRGILSWHSQLQDRRLREAGTYGELLRVPIPRAALDAAARTGTLEVRLAVDPALPGGLALYGASFGRFPLDPTVVFGLREE